METIRVYAPDSAEYKKLQHAAQELTDTSKTGKVYLVEETYFDFGQNWSWTTIIAHRSDGATWQAINPAQQEQILLAEDIPEVVRQIRSYEYWYEG